MRRIQGKRACLAAVGLGAWLAILPAASASNHLIKIREVYPGSVAHPGDEYVELQMYSSGQNLFHFGTTTTLYDATGGSAGTFVTNGSSSDPPNSANQDRVLIATQSAANDFGITPVGYIFAAGDHLSPTGGAACYTPTAAGLNIDCVSWGNFSGSLPASTGGNVDPTGIPDGKALGRSIAAGCPTLLEQGDDTNHPANWSDVTPHPLKNSDTPPEHPCANTAITKAPKAKTSDRTPTFKFVSTVDPATFECKIDSDAFQSCTSPFTAPKLSLGAHTFKVRATANGVTDATPAKASFKVIKKHH